MKDYSAASGFVSGLTGTNWLPTIQTSSLSAETMGVQASPAERLTDTGHKSTLGAQFFGAGWDNTIEDYLGRQNGSDGGMFGERLLYERL
jgi:hypothetical protein